MSTRKPATPDPSEPTDLEARIDEAHKRLREHSAFVLKVSGSNKILVPHKHALLFPPLSRDALAAMTYDVVTQGFLQPVLLVGTQILEGRHRCAVAWILNAPVKKNVTFGPALKADSTKAASISSLPYTEFEGTEDQAFHLVHSLNGHRRHLTKPQMALIVRAGWLAVAEAEAEARMLSGGSGPSGAISGGSEPSGTISGGSGEAADLAARRSGYDISGKSVRSMAIVEKAPETLQRVENYEITTIAEAVREAEAEVAALDPEPDPEPPAKKLAPKDGDEIDGLLLAARDAMADAVKRREDGEIAFMSVARQRAVLGELSDHVTAYMSLIEDDPE